MQSSDQSDRFKKIYAKLKEIVMREFPNATEGEAFGMRGFRAKITKEDIKEWKGTMNPNYFFVCPVERKAGITLHIWYPVDYYALDKIRKEYEEAGFKVMRGCLQWNRKSEYPIHMIEDLVKNIARDVRK